MLPERGVTLNGVYIVVCSEYLWLLWCNSVKPSKNTINTVLSYLSLCSFTLALRNSYFITSTYIAHVIYILTATLLLTLETKQTRSSNRSRNSFSCFEPFQFKCNSARDLHFSSILMISTLNSINTVTDR